MNYIHQLQQTVEGLRKQVQDYEETIHDLHRYLHLKKFRCGDDLDGYVNIQDIINRTQLEGLHHEDHGSTARNLKAL